MGCDVVFRHLLSENMSNDLQGNFTRNVSKHNDTTSSLVSPEIAAQNAILPKPTMGSNLNGTNATNATLQTNYTNDGTLSKARNKDGFFSEDTGILDSVNFLQSLEYFAKKNGTFFSYNTIPINIQKNKNNFKIQIKNYDSSEDEITANLIINTAGHGAPEIAAMSGYQIDGDDPNVPILRQHVNRGVYFDIINNKINHSIDNLVYPVPSNQEKMQDHINASGGLGIHLTKTLDGDLKLGPDAEWLNNDDEMDYINNGKKSKLFFISGKSILPKLNIEDIAPSHVGYRSRLQTKNNQYADFLIWKDKQYIHLGGIESPGLTASLAIAKKIKNLL